MTALEKTIAGITVVKARMEFHRHASAKVVGDALELLKGFKKIKEQLEELRIMEDSKIKECDSYCDWEAKKYHQGRFDAYSIALAGFEQKDGEQGEQSY